MYGTKYVVQNGSDDFAAMELRLLAAQQVVFTALRTNRIEEATSASQVVDFSGLAR